jgi:hypothetical protein
MIRSRVPALGYVPIVSATVLAGLLALTCAGRPGPAPQTASPRPEAMLAMASPVTVAADAGQVAGSGPVEPARAGPSPESVPETPRASNLPPLVLIRYNGGGRYELSPETELGGFDEQDLEAAREAMAYRGGESHDIHPRLLDLLYITARHFDVPQVVVTSGYRPGRKASLHAWGRAADIELPGVDYRALAEYARGLGFVGVGYYPRTGSVHLDVREQSYFWVSWAPRGRRWREQQILPDLARDMDRQARARGVEPPDPLPEAGRVARERSSRRRRTHPVARRRAPVAHAAIRPPAVASRQSRRDPP